MGDGVAMMRKFLRANAWAILTTVGAVACWQDAVASRDLHRAWMAGFLACWSVGEIRRRR